MKTVTLFLGLCLVFVFVWERVDVVRIGYQIERLKRDKTVLERQRDELRVKFSALSASDRIAKLATEKLGMSLVDIVVRRHVDDVGILGMELDEDDRIAAVATNERENKKKGYKKISHKRLSAFPQDAQTGHPTRPQGESYAEACSVLHVEVDDRPRTQLEARFSILPIGSS